MIKPGSMKASVYSLCFSKRPLSEFDFFGWKGVFLTSGVGRFLVYNVVQNCVNLSGRFFNANCAERFYHYPQ